MKSPKLKAEGRTRVVISQVEPEIEEGRFPIKRTAGETVTVKANIFADGHDELAAVLQYRAVGQKEWAEVIMRPLGNDRWQGSFVIEKEKGYLYTLWAWIDYFKTWQKDLKAKCEASQDISAQLLLGVDHIKQAAAQAAGKDSQRLKQFAALLKDAKDADTLLTLATSDELTLLMAAYLDKSLSMRYGKQLRVLVERKKALFSSWYEFFPRSQGPKPGAHGTFRDCAKLLPEIAGMGFDVVYLPPIHPIGKTSRKGKDNAAAAAPDDPGSLWAIGSEKGGHDAVHAQLGNIKDFKYFIKEAANCGLEAALDLAFQCSRDHPYIKKYPQWFKKRPDGSIQYAENPPKKYEDIVPINFETEDWQALWEELLRVVMFWVKTGVKIFRVDNPHTKPFAFWEWLISEVKEKNPEVLFLAEAFTRPNVMYRLAKLGFSQSYTYFSWRNTKNELTQYLNELTKTQVREFFRPNFWPNTPDILPEYLQYGGRAAHIIRFILAATLSSNYGIYGPVFELYESEPLPNKEEYSHSEKYELRYWDRNKPGNLKDLISRVNQARKSHAALQETSNIEFCDIDNPKMLAYLKIARQAEDVLLVVVNLDPHHTQSGWVSLPLEETGLDAQQSYLMYDLLSEDKYIWHGERNYVELNPSVLPAHILYLQKRTHNEKDFDYFM